MYMRNETVHFRLTYYLTSPLSTAIERSAVVSQAPAKKTLMLFSYDFAWKSKRLFINWISVAELRLSVMEGDFLDFLVEDELSSVTLLVEGQRLYVHREVLAAWSPVFRAMFVGMFKEKDMKEVELPEKKVEDFIELLHCMYPPIHPITGCCCY